MLITVEEYIGMGFPEVDSRNISGCIQRSDYIIAALTEGRAEKALQSGGRQAELVKQAAGFQTYQLLREMELIDGSGDSSVCSFSVPLYFSSRQPPIINRDSRINKIARIFICIC